MRLRGCVPEEKAQAMVEALEALPGNHGTRRVLGPGSLCRPKCGLPGPCWELGVFILQ